MAAASLQMLLQQLSLGLYLIQQSTVLVEFFTWKRMRSAKETFLAIRNPYIFSTTNSNSKRSNFFTLLKIYMYMECFGDIAESVFWRELLTSLIAHH